MLQQAVDGLAEGCRAFDIPVTGGNVSPFIINRPRVPIDPTPTVGIVGQILDDAKHITPSHFQNQGDVIILVGGPANGGIGEELGASLYLREIHGLKKGRPPELNIERELKMHDAVRAAIRTGNIHSAHDLADGGLLVALAECAIGGAHQLGADVELNAGDTRVDAALFGESQSRAILTTSADKAAAVLALFAQNGVPAKQIGTVGGTQLIVQVKTASVPTQSAPGTAYMSTTGNHKIHWNVADLYQAWDRALDSYLA